MGEDLSAMELSLLTKAKATYSPFSVTGYLFGVLPCEDICFGRVYAHVRANPNTGRFMDGHLMRTSTVMSVFEKDQIISVATLNSFYVCVTFGVERSQFIAHFDVLSNAVKH